MYRPLLNLALAGSIACAPLAFAEEVTLQHQGLTLNANLNLSEDTGFDKVILITHGTLAHNGMEIISTWQDLLADEGYTTLAINLSLGLDNRHGMYDCATPHNHKHTDAVTEISAWVDWLKSKGTESVILGAHSRGGNQTAWYSNTAADPVVKAQILVAPQTWNADYDQENYKQRYKQELTPLLAEAKTLPEDKMMSKTDFIYCEDTQVSAASFINYYTPDERFDTPTLLKTTSMPTLVFIGSEDKTVKQLGDKMAAISNDKVSSVEVEGADHFFRDLYMDEVIEGTLEFLEQI